MISREYSVAAKNMGSGVRRLGLDHGLYLLGMKPCTVYSTSLFLCFFIYKIIIVLGRLHIVAERKGTFNKY